MKAVAKMLAPPLIWNAAGYVLRRLPGMRATEPARGAKGSEYYDRGYASVEECRVHYTASRYYFLWAVVVDRILQSGLRSILEIGCGSGQFAELLYDRGIRDYFGVDLSETAISFARSVCPEFHFAAEDVFQSNVLGERRSEAVVCLEVLEHLEHDLDLLERIAPACRVYASVPNFPYESHVRHFADCREVEQRYAPLFATFRVDALLGDQKGKTYFLFDGVKR